MADLDIEELYPKPDLGDLLTMRERLERHRGPWLELVNQVRTMRYHEDEPPAKWAQRLSSDRRFRTNLTDNEIGRVAALMNRNKPKVYVPATGERTKLVERSQTETQFGQEVLEAYERGSMLPIADRVDDAAVETSLGVYEWFLTPVYDQYVELQEELAGMKDGEAKREKEAELRALGLPFGLRSLDPTTVYWEPGNEDGRAAAVLIVERKDYKQVFRELADTLDNEAWGKASLPPIAALGMPTRDVWGVRWSENIEDEYDGAPGEDGDVEVMRYYDGYWLVQVVAGRIVQCEPHSLPGTPLFFQFGRVTSSSYTGHMLRGVTFGMIEHETALNDIITLWEDNEYAYGRPFPVVETAENGSALTDKDGNPQTINLLNPHEPPQLGPGQKIADAFAGFKGNIDPQFIQLLGAYFHMSGINPVAQGESPGADVSGFALNTQVMSATALYSQLLKNKQRTIGQIVDFTRQAVKLLDCPVTITAGGGEGEPIEYITLRPDDVSDVPTRVTIDPLSDAQRLAITDWILGGMERGMVDRRTAQRVAYGSVIDDFDAEDDAILRSRAREMLVPVLVRAVVARVVQDAFPELATPPVPPGGEGGDDGGSGEEAGAADALEPPPSSTMGEGAEASRVSAPTGSGPSASQRLSARGRGGQQPRNQGVPAVRG